MGIEGHFRLEPVEHLLIANGFIPHGHCYLWQRELVELHVASDALIAIAYYSIPITLIYFVRKRRDLPFSWIFQLFSAFIIACGSTHLMEVWTLWYPTYWLSGVLKAATALVSLHTAVILVPSVFTALALPSPAQIEAANRDLEREIAERKQVEETLRQSEARYRAVVEDQTEMICRFLPNQTFTFVNEAYCRYFERTREETIGHSWTPIILEEDLELVERQLAALSQENPVVTVINRVVRPDGAVRTQQWSNRVIFDQHGNVAEYQAVGRDITELQETEAALQESRRFVEKIANTVPVILYVYDLFEQRNVYANREIIDLLGYTAEEVAAMRGELLKAIFHPDDLILLPGRNKHWETAQEGEIIQTEYRLKHRDGEWRYFQCQETLFARTQDGLPKQILGGAVDVTDRKQTQQLQSALKEKEVLLKEIHHRVKNNLQIIYSLLRLQRRQVKDQQSAEILLDSQNRIKSIALLHEKLYRSEDLSQIYSSQYIPTLIAGLFSSYQINSNTINLNTEIDDISLDIDTAIPCGLVINELVSNSLKYAFSEEGKGEIWIGFQVEQGNKIKLTVGDNGVGIPQDFDFERAHSLGLKLVKDLVDQLEGTIEIDRSRGTEFKIIFSGSKA